VNLATFPERKNTGATPRIEALRQIRTVILTRSAIFRLFSLQLSALSFAGGLDSVFKNLRDSTRFDLKTTTYNILQASRLKSASGPGCAGLSACHRD